MFELCYTGKKKRESILESVVDVDYTVLNDGVNDDLLIFGDNLKGLYCCLSNLGLKECVDLIYIDPPYNTGNTFRLGATISTEKQKPIAYTDKYKEEEYIELIRERIILLYELLSPQGSFYLHCDTKNSHYLKIILDEIFTRNNFKSDITRRKTNSKNFKMKNYGNIKDQILFYTKTDDYIWNYPS